MDYRSAASLIKDAVPRETATWADLGAGTGTFTLGLASLLGAGSRVIAVDIDGAALAELEHAAGSAGLVSEVLTVAADFRQPLDLPRLDGLMLANALHFVPSGEQGAVLSRLVNHLRPGGRVIIVDYDGRRANAWVPFPVSSRRLSELLPELGLEAPRVVGRRPSRYGGSIYAASSAVSG